MNLRKLARGRDCMVRLPNICNRDSSTTVLAHLRLGGLSGMGIKAEDVFGAWACSSCHDYADSHKDSATQLGFAQGIFRTQAHLIKQGMLKW